MDAPVKLIIQDNLSILRNITKIYLQKCLLPCKLPYSQVLGFRIWTYSGVITQPTTFTKWHGNSTPRYISKRNKTIRPHKILQMNIHISVIHNNQKVETMQMSINWWMDKLKYSTPYKEILVKKKGNEMLIYAATQMNFENIMLSERSQ